MRVSKTVSHALAAVQFLACNEGRHNARTIAESIDRPTGYVKTVLNNLCNAGILSSNKGPGGGYCLAKKPTQITLLDIIDAVETQQPSWLDGVPKAVCDAVGKAEKATHRHLSGVKLSHITTS